MNEEYELSLEDLILEDWGYKNYEDYHSLEDAHKIINEINNHDPDDRDYEINLRPGDLVTWKHNWVNAMKQGRQHPYGLIISEGYQGGSDSVKVMWGESSEIVSVAKKDLKLCN